MSHPPSTPVKVPTSAATYTPATLDPDLRSQINAVLLREGYITKIQEQLLHSLDAHPSNWPSAVQTHALTLLRTGEASTFPALIRRVLEDVRHDTATVRAAEAAGTTGTNNNNGTTTTTTTTTNNSSSSSSTTNNANNATTDGTSSSTTTTDANSDSTTAAPAAAKNGDSANANGNGNGASTAAAAAVVVNGNNKKKTGAVNGISSGASGENGLAVPAAVLETVLKLARESLDAVCQLDDTPATTNGG
ncbi:hypothetical protein MGN70_011129 [Eutypa lata]|nr:hypothetical protein MGN70_011129 [Eutypa lata]